MTEPGATLTVRVGNPFVRVFHWSRVALVGAAWLTGGGPKWLHETVGCVLAAARPVWGVVGPDHARFAIFVRGPRTVGRYLGALAHEQARRNLGHTPAGGAMIVALLATVTTPVFRGSSTTEDVHESAVILVLILASIQIAGVIVERLRHREYLVGAVITGRKRGTGKETP